MHERLSLARKEAGFENAADAAKALGVPYPTYAGHENGSSGFKNDAADKYARKFKVRFEWLVLGRGPMNESPSDDPEIRQALEFLLKARESGHFDEATSFLQYVASKSANS